MAPTTAAFPANVPQQPEPDLTRIPAHVHSVTFSGLSDRTRDDFLVRVAKDILLHQRPPVRSFDQLIRRSSELRRQLQHGLNGCFSSVLVTIDSAPAAAAADHEYSVQVSVRERKPLTGSVMTTTSVHGGCGPTLETGARANNVLGRGESVAVSYVIGSKRQDGGGGGGGSGVRGYSIAASKPLLFPTTTATEGGRGGEFAPRYPLLTAAAFDSESQFPLSGFKQRERGVQLDLFAHWSARLTSRLTLQSDWRDLATTVSPEQEESLKEQLLVIPDAIRSAAGSGHQFAKTGLKHVLAYDGRSFSSSFFPSSGLLAELTTSACSGLAIGSRVLLPGNQSFARHEAHVQVNERVPGTRVLLQACFRTGLLLPFHHSLLPQQPHPPQGVAISEKFFVGGPLTMRGFSTFGVGPSSVGSEDGGRSVRKFPLGADLFWSAGAHAYLPLPFVRRPSAAGRPTIAGVLDQCVRMHVFANAASAAAFVPSSNGANSDWWREAQAAAAGSLVRTSVGAGLVLAAGPALRIELNYALPLKWNSACDSPDPGFQFGFGIHYN